MTASRPLSSRPCAVQARTVCPSHTSSPTGSNSGREIPAVGARDAMVLGHGVREAGVVVRVLVEQAEGVRTLASKLTKCSVASAALSSSLAAALWMRSSVRTMMGHALRLARPASPWTRPSRDRSAPDGRGQKAAGKSQKAEESRGGSRSWAGGVPAVTVGLPGRSEFRRDVRRRRLAGSSWSR